VIGHERRHVAECTVTANPTADSRHGPGKGALTCIDATGSGDVSATGKVFTGNENGLLTILEAGKELKILGSVSLGSAVDCAPVAANGVLYITTQTHLYAVRG
jgi:hypothetical protein